MGSPLCSHSRVPAGGFYRTPCSQPPDSAVGAPPAALSLLLADGRLGERSASEMEGAGPSFITSKGLYVSVCLSICLFILLSSVCLSVCVVCPSVHLSFCLSICLSVPVSICLCCLSICPSVCPPI